MTTLIIVASISIVANIILLVGVRNLLKQTEELEDSISNLKFDTITKVENALQQMRDIDNREVFEKDDEVGATFQQLKTIIEDLNNEI